MLFSVQSGGSQQQSSVDGAAVNSNVSVRSAAAAAAAESDAAEVHPDTSLSPGSHRSRHVMSRSEPVSTFRYRNVILTAVALLATQFAARPR